MSICVSGICTYFPLCSLYIQQHVFFFFKLEDNCFIMWYWSLLYNSLNQS